ncbi:MAG: ABC transporter permease [Thermodesulfobacteriota bacterium]|nr:ABC transporter permease [Thermodesulfobacteriota bacterium]
MLWETILLASREIRRNVMRSSLTILGIVIGVSAVITMVTLGRGATAQVTTEISSLGSNLLHARPGQRGRGPGGTRSTADMFDVDDAEAIVREISGLAAVAPIASQATQAIYGNENWSTAVTGSTNAYLQVRDWDLENGRQFSGGELRAGKAVCILGTTVRDVLFGGQDPLGATIRLEKLSCQVIGVFESKGQSSFGADQDDFVLIPLRTLQRRIAGNTDVSGIYVSAQDGVSTEKVEKDIEDLMRERRHISIGEDDDFHVNDMQELVSTMTGTTRVLTGLLGAVAAVSLLVGGIGIMNIMLVSVTERTREIGIRLAIGALERDVLMQFLVEAVVLSSFGGLVGIVLGLAAAGVGAHFLGVPFVLNPGIVVIAFAFSAAVGVLFGYFPARQAGRLDPIEALRHE